MEESRNDDGYESCESNWEKWGLVTWDDLWVQSSQPWQEWVRPSDCAEELERARRLADLPNAYWVSFSLRVDGSSCLRWPRVATHGISSRFLDAAYVVKRLSTRLDAMARDLESNPEVFKA